MDRLERSERQWKRGREQRAIEEEQLREYVEKLYPLFSHLDRERGFTSGRKLA